MPVTIQHNLLPVHFSRNAVEVRFSTPDKFTTQGARNETLITFNTYPTAGGQLEVIYEKDGEEIDRVFEFVSNPDPDAFEISTYSGSGLEEWLKEVVAGLQGDPFLAEDFIISYYDDDPVYGIYFRAQFESDTNVQIGWAGISLSVGHPVDGAIAAARTNYRLSAWLYLGRTNAATAMIYDRTPEIELDADENSLVELNLKKYLDDMLYDYEQPPTSVSPAICTVINRPAYILFGQKWGDPIERKKQWKSDIFRVIKGGLTDRDFADAKTDLGAWLQGRFLTNRYERKIRSDQDDYLYWYCHEDVSNVDIKVDKILTGGGTIIETIASPGNMEAGVTYKFKINQTLANSTNVARFSVYLSNIVGGSLTNKVHYIPDDNYLDTVFEFENGQGGIESWKFSGERSIGHEITKALYKTQLPFDAEVSDRSLQSYNERDTMQMTISTGPLSLSESRAFPDFLRSRFVWLVEGDHRIPVRIPEGKHLAESRNLSGNYKRGAEFTVELGDSMSVSREVM